MQNSMAESDGIRRQLWNKKSKGCRTGRTLRISSGKPGEVRERSLVTAIPAEVLAVDRQRDQFHVVVRIALTKYRGSFETLVFGKNKPFVGSCHEGRLDLIYLQDPGLNAGQEFPLWTIQ